METRAAELTLNNHGPYHPLMMSCDDTGTSQIGFQVQLQERTRLSSEPEQLRGSGSVGAEAGGGAGAAVVGGAEIQAESMKEEDGKSEEAWLGGSERRRWKKRGNG